MEEVKQLKKILRERGLTNKQVEAGIKYYMNFCKRLDINIAKSVRMITKMVERMREYYEKA